jgi:hypothetical protein
MVDLAEEVIPVSFRVLEKKENYKRKFARPRSIRKIKIFHSLVFLVLRKTEKDQHLILHLTYLFDFSSKKKTPEKSLKTAKLISEFLPH